jgi:glycosyltransferase involved in cell wall biosynthesis
MKIALCLEYPIDQFGGTEVLVRELIQGLAAQHDIVLVSPDDPAAIGKSPIRPNLTRHILWKPEQISVPNSRRLAQALQVEGVQLAHFHFGGNYSWGNRYFTKSPILAVSRVGIPCLSTNHGAFSILDGYCGPQRKILRWFLLPPAWINKLHVLAHLRIEIAVSQHDYHALRRWYPPMRSKFGQIYHSRIHGPPPPPVKERARAIICVGTIGLRKGQTFLVDAFARIAGRFPDWKLVLIGRHGDSSMLEHIRATVAANHLHERVLLLNECSNPEVEQWLKAAAIFAIPSLAEGLGLSLQEALFNGCACIASAAGGMTDLVQHDSNGLLARPGDVGDLARGLQTLMADEKLRQRLATRGVQSILEKDMLADKMVAKYDQLYRELLRGSL